MTTPLSLRLGLTTAGIAAASLLAAVDPATSHRFPRCIFLSLTGFECPGCGSTRAIHQLLNGHLISALDLNVMTVLATPWLMWRFGNWLFGHRVASTGRSFKWIAAVGITVLCFGVARNLPWNPFTVLSASR